MATIEQRGSSYRITVSVGYDVSGKQIRRSMTFKPDIGMTKKQIKKELERQAVLFEEHIKSGLFVDSTIKFADFAQKWLDEYGKEHLRATTYRRYTDCLTRINQAIGHMRIDRIQPTHLLSFYKNLSEQGIRSDTKYSPNAEIKALIKSKGMTQTAFAERAKLSIGTIKEAMRGNNVNYTSAAAISETLGMPLRSLFNAVGADETLANSTIQYYHRVISSILATAVQWQVILFNPCDRVKPPKSERKEAKYLDDKQAAELLTALDSEPILYKTLFSVIMLTGMRRGEACGLNWGDIDLDRAIIDINKSSLYTPDNGLFEDETKNETSRRVIKIPTLAVDMLKQYRAHQAALKLKLGDKWRASDKVFTSESGLPIHPDTVTSHFREFIKKTDLPQITVHSLRHTNATLMIANGTDLKTVSKRLGHASVSTTGNIYTHAIKSADELAADKLTDIFINQKQA